MQVSRLAKQRLPGPIFNYIDGAADDEVTHRRNTAAFESCDLLPSVLRGVTEVDMSVTVMGQKLAMPVYCSPTALQRLFHHQGERAVAAAADKFGTMFGVSSLGTVSLEEARRISKSPQLYQFYFHKDRGLNRACPGRPTRVAFGAGPPARNRVTPRPGGLGELCPCAGVVRYEWPRIVTRTGGRWRPKAAWMSPSQRSGVSNPSGVSPCSTTAPCSITATR